MVPVWLIAVVSGLAGSIVAKAGPRVAEIYDKYVASKMSPGDALIAAATPPRSATTATEAPTAEIAAGEPYPAQTPKYQYAPELIGRYGPNDSAPHCNCAPGAACSCISH